MRTPIEEWVMASLAALGMVAVIWRH